MAKQQFWHTGPQWSHQPVGELVWHLWKCLDIMCHHLYADDMQIYITLSKSKPEMSLALLQDCLLDVGDWMRSSKLKLNPDKTEFSLFGTKLHRKEFMKHFPAKLLDQEITPTDSAQNLGSHV